MSTSSPTTHTELLLACENLLGWNAPLGYQLRTVEVLKIKRVMAKNSQLYTIHNMMLALEYCRQFGIEIERPAQLCGYVKTALERARDDTPLTSVEQQRSDAIELEMGRDADDSDYWIGRLTRAGGPGLLLALTAWRAHQSAESAGA